MNYSQRLESFLDSHVESIYLDGLPEHPFFELAGSMDLFLKDKQAYPLNVAGEGEESISLNGQRYSLGEPVSLRTLDDLFFQRADDSIDEWKKRQAKNVIDSLNLNREYTIPEKIYLNIFPLLRETKSTKRLSDLLLTNQEGSYTDNLIENPHPNSPVLRKLRELKKEFLTNASTSNYGTSIENALSAPFIAIQTGIANSLRVDYSDKYFSENSISLKDIRREYSKILSQALTKEVCKENLSEENISKLAKSKLLSIPDFNGVSEYEEGEAGFIKNGESWYATLRVPTFAIKSPENGFYFKFNSFRIGINSSSPEYVCAIDKVNHPFVQHYEDNRLKVVCFGDNALATGNSSEETVALRLKQARQILMQGYRSSNIRPFRRLTFFSHLDFRGKMQRGFSRHIVPSMLLKSRGIPIFYPSKIGKK